MNKHKKMRAVFMPILLAAIILLCCVPIQVKAAARTIGNMVIMVTFQYDTDGNSLKNEFVEGYSQNSFFYKWSPNTGSGASVTQPYITYYRDIFTASTSSLPHYINTVSDGQVNVRCYFPQESVDGKITTITLPGSASDYLNPNSSEDSKFLAAVINALKNTSFSTQLSASQLDSWDGDGYIDNLTILVQGSNTGSFTSHKNNYGGTETVCFGLKIGSYNVISTEALRSSGYSVVSHEFMHTLGATDLYRTGKAGTPVGIWDQMAEVSPMAQYPLVYTRSTLGWLTIPEITATGNYTLRPATDTSGNRAYILKTSMSDSEFFVIEYRQKKGYSSYDSRIPVDNGLIVYRVNTLVSNPSNTNGENYIYVYRPGTSSDHEAATETIPYYGSYRSAVYDAAIGTASRPSLGSSNLSDDCTKDTIFYSDGNNSGIVINNISFNSDGSATFHVEFPDFDEDTTWIKQDNTMQGISGVQLAGDTHSNVLYLAGVRGDSDATSSIAVYSNNLSGTGYVQIGSDIPACGITQNPDIIYNNDKLYIAYLNRNYLPCISMWNGKTWTLMGIGKHQYASHLQLIDYNGTIYLSYVHDGNTFELWNPVTGDVLSSLKVNSAAISNPSTFIYKNELYVVYSDYFASGDAKKGKIAKYVNTAWKDIYTIDNISSISSSEAYVYDNVVYIMAACSSETPIMLIGTPDKGWTVKSLDGINGTNIIRMTQKDGVPYLIWCDGSSLKAGYYDKTWHNMSAQICNDAFSYAATCIDNMIYVANSSMTRSTTIRKMKAADINPSTPVTPTPGLYDIILPLPSGYNISDIYIDGKAYTSSSWNNDSNKRLVNIGNPDAKTAIMYNYNSSGTPVGMYVWQLSHNGNSYSATALTDFTDIFSYHGFSVRYTGKTGLRCTFGIDADKKKKLTSGSTLSGYKLIEMGTLVMHPTKHAETPMVYGSKSVSAGRSYYIDGNKVYNKILRTANGREQFANVLVGLPDNRYNISYYFKAYAILEKNGEQIILYGPEMSRSMYTVCKQILNRGDFKPGTSGYSFLKNIVDSVENTNK